MVVFGKRLTLGSWNNKEKLASGDYSPCAICGKPCPPEEGVGDAHGRLMHKACYRASRISMQQLGR
jgi:hypothetical protein